MRKPSAAIAAVLLLSLAACSSAGPSASGNASPGASNPAASLGSFEPGNASDVGRYFRIMELGLGSNGYVTLQNYTDTAASLGTLYLCQGQKCVDLPDYPVPGGSEVRVAVGDGAGLEAVAMKDADLDLPPADGEVALYSSQKLDDINSMKSYLEWGKTPHALTKTAIDAAIWLNGSYAPTSANATRLFQREGGWWVFDE